MKELVKKRKSKLVKSTTLFMALFVTALMLGSTVPAAIPNNPVNENIYERPRILPQITNNAANSFISSTSMNSVSEQSSQNEQPSDAEVVLYYHSGFDDNAVGFNGAQTWEGAIRFTPTELAPYSGYSLVAMNWQHYDNDGGADTGVVRIYGEGTASTPGTLLQEIPYADAPVGLNRVDLTTPLVIDTTHDLWVSIELVQTTAGYPLGVDAGPQVDGKGAFLYYGGSWYELQDLGLDYNWILEGVIDILGPAPDHDIQTISIDAPVDGPAGAGIVPQATIKNGGNNTETNVPVQFQIEKQGASTQVLYESFEDVTYPPAGWTIYGDAYNVRYSGGHEGTYAARMYSYGYGYWGELDTATFDASGATGGVYLNFWHKQLVWAGDQDQLYVFVTPDLYNYYMVAYYGSSMDWTYETIDISAYASATMQVWFYALCDYGYGVYLDGIEIETLDAPVLEYDETVYVGSIDVGATAAVTFPAWTPADWGVAENVDIGYNSMAEATVAGDAIPTNDAMADTFTLSYPFIHDLACIEIIEPTEDALAQEFDIGFTIQNVGQVAETYTTSWMNIGEIQYVGTAFAEYDWPSVPGTWTDEQSGWYKSYSSNAGGTSPEAYLPYYNAVANMKFYSPAFSTAGYAGAQLTTKSYINHYSGQGLYTLNAVASADNGATWSTIWSFSPGSSQQFEITGPVPIGSNVRIGFMVTGDPYYFNYWYIDDVEVTLTNVVSEFNEGCSIDWQGIAPGEIVEFTSQGGDLPTWTPDYLAAGINGVKTYGVTGYTDLAGDGNPSNDLQGVMIDLTFTHDVTIKSVGSPANRGEVIFSQMPYGPYDAWNAYTSASQFPYEVQDDFWDVVGTIGDVHWWGLPLIWSSGWYAGSADGMEFEIKFYEDVGGSPGDLVATFSDLQPDWVDLGYYSWAPAAFWSVDLPSGVTLDTGWISIVSTYSPSGSVFLWLDSPEGNMNALQNGGALGDSVAFNLTAGGGGGPGAPPVSVYVPIGADAVEYVVNNVGTFQENDLTAYADIYDFTANLTNGTLVYSENITGIDLAPLGGEDTETFPSYTYAVEGRYGVYFDIPVTDDEKPANNMKAIGVGCDNTAPTTTHTVTPAAPDGLANWYISDVEIKLTATDPTVNDVASGVDYIEYQVDGGAWTTYTAPFKVTTDSANHVVKYRAVDNVGNTEAEKTVPAFKVDKTKPVISSMTYNVTGGNAIQGWEMTFYVTATDAMSGMVKVEFYFNDLLQETVTGAGPEYVWVYQFTPLPNVVVKAIAFDEAGWTIEETIENPTSTETAQQLTTQTNIL